MKDQKLQIAECARTGVLKSIYEVPLGVQCGCVIAGTTIPLVAKNNGKAPGDLPTPGKRIAHFSLVSGSDDELALESALHVLAKRVFLEEKLLWLPRLGLSLSFRSKLEHAVKDLFTQAGRSDYEYYFYTSALDVAENEVDRRAKATVVKFDEVKLEVPFRAGYAEFRADAIGYAGKRQLIVEFKVTHAVDEVKSIAIASSGLSCVEIDLSEFHQLDKEGKVNYLGIRQLLLGEMAQKINWISNSRGMKIEKEVIEFVLDSAREFIRNKLSKEQREADPGYFKVRKMVGYQAKKVYGHVAKSVYCPGNSGMEVGTYTCRDCPYYGERFFFPDKQTGAQVELILCGYENKLQTESIRQLKGAWRRKQPAPAQG